MQRLRTAALLAAAGLASAAAAQPSWTTQMQFALSPTGAALPNNALFVTATGTYTFYVRVGIFNLTGTGPGQSNQGLNDWTANATVSGLRPGDSLGLTPATSRVAPFDFGPASSFGGVIPPGGSAINSIDCARDVTGGAQAQWLWDTNISSPAPQPTAPTNSPLGNFAPAGINSSVSVFRFTFTNVNISAFETDITFAGQAGPILRWSAISSQPPTEPADPGNIHFIGLTPTPILASYVQSTLIIFREPAPSGASVLFLGCLLAARRRRT